MRSLTASLTGYVANDDGIALNQTPGAAGNLTFNGDGGATVLQTISIPDTSAPPFYGTTTQVAAILNPPRQLLFTTASDESGKTITVTGYDRSGVRTTETITGPNATIGTTTKIFAKVLTIAVSAAFTGNVKVGWNAVAYTRWIFLGQKSGNNAYTKVRVIVGGTVNYDIETTTMDMNKLFLRGEGRWDNAPEYTGGEIPDDVDNSYGSAKTASFGVDIPAPVAAVRVKLNSNTTGTIKLRVIAPTCG